MDGWVLIGLLEIVAISLAPVAILSAFSHAPAIYQRTLLAGRRLHLFHTPPVAPAGPPLEELAADLRRLRLEARSPRAGAMVQQSDAIAAYDEVLMATARALDVPTGLDELPEGSFHREAERLRLEQALERAGLTWQLRQD